MRSIGADTKLTACAIAVAFAATMIAMWSLAHERFAWGAYNAVIVVVALAVVVAVRARRPDI